VSYYIPKRQQRFETSIKRSRFITSIAPIDSREKAKHFLNDVRTEFPDANHHCWAHILNDPKASHGQDQSDDGEPKGTAGKPMLNVLQHSGLGQVMVIVTRYFGGVKLGAGGLVRAYSNVVSEAIKELVTEEFLVKEMVSIQLPYSLLNTLKHRLEKTRAHINQEIFKENIGLILEYPIADQTLLFELLDEIGQGSIIYTKTR